MADFLRNVHLHPEVEIDRKAFPFTLPAFRGFRKLEFHPSVTFFVGENGGGKSTLLEALALLMDLPAEGGTRDHRFQTFDSHSDFQDKLRLARGERPREMFFLRAETVYNLSTYLVQSKGTRFGFAHERSHGEEFLAMFTSLRPDGLFLFDEPEAALSPARQMAFLTWLHRMVHANCQFIITTHSPIILSYPDATILEFSDNGIEPIEYEDCEPFKLTRDFLAAPARFLRGLLVED